MQMDITRNPKVPQRSPVQSVAPSRRFRPTRVHIATAIAVVLLVGVALWWLFFKGQQHIMSGRYQAVHLENGQIFFGKLQNTGGDFLTLRDPYYTPQLSTKADDKTPTQTQLSLIKVGEEVYGPERSVSIARSTVQYWENLRDDSKVIDAIKQQQ